MAQAPEHLGFLATFAHLDNPTFSALTRNRLGWEPTHPGLIADLQDGQLLRVTARLGGSRCAGLVNPSGADLVAQGVDLVPGVGTNNPVDRQSCRLLKRLDARFGLAPEDSVDAVGVETGEGEAALSSPHRQARGTNAEYRLVELSGLVDVAPRDRTDYAVDGDAPRVLIGLHGRLGLGAELPVDRTRIVSEFGKRDLQLPYSLATRALSECRFSHDPIPQVRSLVDGHSIDQLASEGFFSLLQDLRG